MEHKFTPRQYMVKNDFEFFHTKEELPPNIEYHNHDFYEIFFYISGKVTYVIEGKSYKLKPGDIILINNRELHRTIIESGEDYERIVIWIKPDYIINLNTDSTDLTMCFESSAKKKYNLLRPDTETLAYLKTIVQKLEKAYYNSGFGSEVLKYAYVNELVVYLNKAYLYTKDEEIEVDIEYNQKISNIIKYINANLDSQLSLENISAQFYISKYHLLREFKKYTGFTIHRFIQKKRLIMARMLLKENVKVSEVSLVCGFGDYSNFIRTFKREYGISPKVFAREIIQGRDI
ncbi:AraC family transcriptional regulator [Ruminiclostridium cellobioparum]|uniref:AraC family transcriptional regulator n=1 Tax=Ruminiclostridium cellobioparum subsp. termitidis CT1112 TaxID=1195236 RepID=S0FMC4_RUMCE|nr:AraC family transcriptional regulator [Ruminiclostridium cellobioparum]EMS73062.1 AraC family transcriptional regulator [Ruminiclostridium cellobioparum subsp. termitidis CT1112]